MISLYVAQLRQLLSFNTSLKRAEGLLERRRMADEVDPVIKGRTELFVRSCSFFLLQKENKKGKYQRQKNSLPPYLRYSGGGGRHFPLLPFLKKRLVIKHLTALESGSHNKIPFRGK